MPFYKTPTARALRLSVRTSDFHSEKRGSTPLGRATPPQKELPQTCPPLAHGRLYKSCGTMPDRGRLPITAAILRGRARGPVELGPALRGLEPPRRPPGPACRTSGCVLPTGQRGRANGRRREGQRRQPQVLSKGLYGKVPAKLPAVRFGRPETCDPAFRLADSLRNTRDPARRPPPVKKFTSSQFFILRIHPVPTR